MSKRQRIYLDNATTSWPKPTRATNPAVKCPCVEGKPTATRGVSAASAEDTNGPSLDVGSIPGLQQLWAETLGDPQIRIAILDGPVDTSHPSLSGANLKLIETHLSAAADAGPASQHGTHVASVIFGQHEGPVKGVAPGCTGLIIPIFRDGPDGSVLACSQIDLARAITQAIEHGAHIINISGGQFSPSGSAHPILANLVRKVSQLDSCRDRCALIVAAAGNEGCECLHIPGALPSVIAVGAMDGQGEPLEFSNWGEAYQTQGILGPGENVLGAASGGGTVVRTGTSFATPIVSGFVGLLASLQMSRGERVDTLALRAAILESAHPCDPQQASECRRFLVGQLNIPGVISELTKGVRDSGVESQAADQIETPRTRDDSQQLVYGPQQSGTPFSAARSSQSLVETTTTPNSFETCFARYHFNHERKDIMSDQTQALEMQHQEDDAVGPQDAQIQTAPVDDSSEQRLEASTQTAPTVAKPIAAVSAPASTSLSDTGVMPSQVEPSACGCGGSSPQQLAYAIGTLGIDFGTEARRDSFLGTLDGDLSDGNVLRYLKDKESEDEATSVIWTLSQDSTPIYAIQPFGAYAHKAYETLAEFLGRQLDKDVERVAIPGFVTSGKATLLSGQTVPVLVAEKGARRGMAAWSTRALVAQYKERDRSISEALEDFLNKIYYDLRNLGVTSEDRALNYTATNAFNAFAVFDRALQQNVEFDFISVERSPICRPDSDCHDVKVRFYNPKNLQEADYVFRYTVDVSDVIPVLVEPPRAFRERVR